MAKYHDLTLGQVEAVINKIGGVEGMHKLLAGELKVVPVGEKSATRSDKREQFLVRDGSFSAEKIATNFDPREFYQTRSGLYVFGDFITRIVAAANLVEAGKSFKRTASWKLMQDVTGKVLKSARPKDIWSATDFCAWFFNKLAKQPNGEKGELLNTGWANLFLVEGVNRAVFVVNVDWNSADQEWDVDTWDLDDEWHAGHRFVSKPIVL